jgi:CHAT domain-containing protein
MRRKLYPRPAFPDGHSSLAITLVNLGAALGDRGDGEAAEKFCREGVKMSEALYPREKTPDGHPYFAVALDNLGSVLQQRGKYNEAEEVYLRSLDMSRRQAERLARTAPEAQALNFAASFPLSRDALLSTTRHVPGSDARSYRAVWASKAAITRVYQRRHFALIAAAADESVRKDWDELQSLRRRREQLILAPLPAPSQQAAREEKIDQLTKEIDKLDQSLLPRLPALKHYEDLAKQDPDALQKLLPEGAVLIDILRYVHFEQDPKMPGAKGRKRTVLYLAFLVSRDDVKRVELQTARGRETAADIDTAVREWRETITLKLPADNESARKDHEAKLLRHGQWLRELVWEPVRKQFPAGTKTVLLAPDGDLTQLPWAALPGTDKDTVLLDEYALAVVPHGPFLLEQLTPPPRRSEKRPAPGEGLLLVGGVRYDDKPAADKDGQQRKAEAVVEQKIAWSYLKGTEEERQLLEKLLAKSDLKVTASLTGPAAATARLKQELEGARYAHIGTHGFFADKQFRSVLQLDPKLFERTEFRFGDSVLIGQRIGAGARSPLVLSGLVCAGANRDDTPERGILSADAIAGLLLDDLHLAVLSACDTGLGDVAGGEGVYGLQRAFHIAGCKNVVASLWKVDDAATAALMTRFYSHLFHPDKDKRLSPVEALRRAQLELYRHPELIPAWSRGEQRAPGQPRPAATPPPADTPKELLTSDGRAPVKHWAAFTLSGLGR